MSEHWEQGASITNIFIPATTFKKRGRERGRERERSRCSPTRRTVNYNNYNIIKGKLLRQCSACKCRKVNDLFARKRLSVINRLLNMKLRIVLWMAQFPFCGAIYRLNLYVNIHRYLATQSRKFVCNLGWIRNREKTNGTLTWNCCCQIDYILFPLVFRHLTPKIQYTDIIFFKTQM